VAQPPHGADARPGRVPRHAKEQAMSKFMLMLFDNPAQDINLSPQQMQQVVAEYKQWAEQLARQGKLVGGDKLAEHGGKTLRGSAGKLIITDGPFAEAKEVLGGYFVINANSLDEAVELSKTCPHIKYGSSIQIRKVDEV
jgi:hypothetical protein